MLSKQKTTASPEDAQPKVVSDKNDKKVSASLADPRPVGVLDDIEGGQPHLLHSTALGKAVRVEFPQWDNSEPSIGKPEYVELFWNTKSIERKTYTTHPIPPDELYIDVPEDELLERGHTILYKVTSYTDEDYESLPYTLTIDKTSPELGFSSEPLLDPLIIQDGLSAQYLSDHEGVVIAGIPVYSEPAPGDKITAKWCNESSGVFKEVSKTLTKDDYQDAIQLVFDEALIRDMGDGTRTLSYSVFDRAGNESAMSSQVSFLVAVLRAPHFVPTPWIKEAEGEPADYADLNPLKTTMGATALIPEDAVYYDDDIVVLQFGEPGTVGSNCIDVPFGVKEIVIPPANIAAMFGKSVAVYYKLTLPDTSTKKSTELTLQISALSDSRYPVPQLQSPFTDPVSKAAIPSGGVPVHQRAWPYINDTCLITITVAGRDAQGQPVSHPVLTEHRVEEAQVTAGVHVQLPQVFMRSLAINERFSVTTAVSFDEGDGWTTFMQLKPYLLA